MSESERERKKAWSDGFHSGVLAALACVYDAGQEVVAEEIVAAVGAAALLRIAKREDDMCLKDLRKTVRFLASRARVRELFERGRDIVEARSASTAPPPQPTDATVTIKQYCVYCKNDLHPGWDCVSKTWNRG